MPEPYIPLNFAIMGESQGVGVGAAGFAGAAGLAGAAVTGAAGAGATGFGAPSGGGEAGDFGSSGIPVNAQTSGFQCSGENVNFYQLEDTVSTRGLAPMSQFWLLLTFPDYLRQVKRDFAVVARPKMGGRSYQRSPRSSPNR